MGKEENLEDMLDLYRDSLRQKIEGLTDIYSKQELQKILQEEYDEREKHPKLRKIYEEVCKEKGYNLK